METRVASETLSLAALTVDAERWNDPQEWLGGLKSTFGRQYESAEPQRRAALMRDLDHDLWEFFQDKFAQGGVDFAAEVLKCLEQPSLGDKTAAGIRAAIIRNTAVFQYCPKIGALRKKLLLS